MMATISEILDPTTVALILITIISTVIVMRLSGKLVKRSVSRHNGSEHSIKTAQKLARILVAVIGFMALLGIMGIPASAIGTFLGLIGLGLSFALRDIIANFISGVLILATRPFKIGDQIEVGNEAGTVIDIRLRATDVKTFDGRKVIVPNSALYNETVVNNTGFDNRRFDVVVGIGYDEDIKKAKELAIESLNDAESVEEQPEPQVLVQELGDSSVNLKLRGWTHTGRASVLAAASEVTHLVKDKYDKENIEIPYPVRTVHMNQE